MEKTTYLCPRCYGDSRIAITPRLPNWISSGVEIACGSCRLALAARELMNQPTFQQDTACREPNCASHVPWSSTYCTKCYDAAFGFNGTAFTNPPEETMTDEITVEQAREAVAANCSHDHRLPLGARWRGRIDALIAAVRRDEREKVPDPFAHSPYTCMGCQRRVPENAPCPYGCSGADGFQIGSHTGNAPPPEPDTLGRLEQLARLVDLNFHPEQACVKSNALAEAIDAEIARLTGGADAE